MRLLELVSHWNTDNGVTADPFKCVTQGGGDEIGKFLLDGGILPILPVSDKLEIATHELFSHFLFNSL